MAKLSDVNTKLVDLLRAALAGINHTNIEIGSEWPPREKIAAVGTGGPPIMAIVHKVSSFSRQYMPYKQSENVITAGIESTVSDPSLAAGQSITLTLSLAEDSTGVVADDGVSFQLINGEYNKSAMGIALAGDTLTQFAVRLRDDINAVLSDASVAATSSGAVVTVTNNSSFGYEVLSRPGNVMEEEIATSWASRNLQVMAWSSDLETKFAIQPVVESLLSSLNRGFLLDSGEAIQLKLTGSKPGDADLTQDIYADLFLITVGHTITETELAYEVLAGIGRTITDY